MKTFLAFLFLPFALFAAAPVVTIDDNLNAIVDGANFGKAGDCIVNHKDNSGLVVAVNNALAAKLAAIKAAAAAGIAAANAARDAALVQAGNSTASATAAVNQREAESARVSEIVAALKSVPVGTLPPVVAKAIQDENAKQKAALEEQKAELQKKIDALP